MRRSAVLLVAAVMVGGLVSGCGSSSSTSGAGSSSSSTSRTTSPRNPAAANKILARAGTLRLADLPTGWVETEERTMSRSKAEALLRDTPSCAPYLTLLDGVQVATRSPSFGGPNQAAMSNSVDVLETAEQVASHRPLFAEGGMVTCIADRVKARIAEQVGPGAPPFDVSVSPIAVEEYGDGAYAFRVTVVETTAGGPITTYTDVVGVQVGRVEMTVEPTATTAGELAELEQRVIPKLVARLRAADAG